MARYHFHLSNGVADPDVEGHDLPDLASAQHSAAKLVGQLLLDKPALFWRDGHWLLTVSDERDLTLFTIRVTANEAPVLNATVVATPPAAG